MTANMTRLTPPDCVTRAAAETHSTFEHNVHPGATLREVVCFQAQRSQISHHPILTS